MKVELQDNSRRRKGGYSKNYKVVKLAMCVGNLDIMLVIADKINVLML